jgi:N-acetylmuramoyl-L-alanine amidase
MRISARVAAAATAFFCLLAGATPSYAEGSPAGSAAPVLVAAVTAPMVMLAPIAPKLQAADFATPTKSILLAKPAMAANPSSLASLVADKLASNTADDEHECLAASVYFESKGQPYSGQLAVAETILNRKKSGRFPTSVCGVVKQRGQFGFVRGGHFPSIQRTARQWREAVAIAAIAIKQGWHEVANAALYFNTGRRPGPGLIRVAQFGPQVFYR